MTLPWVDGPELEPLELTPRERRALIHLDAEVNRSPSPLDGHHLLGYPFSLAWPTLIDCKEGSQEEWASLRAGERRRRIEQEVNETWQLLLQVDSSSALHMDWAGGGLLHFCIEREALSKRDFSGVWLNMQFL
jgi:hypothetical protein